MQKLLIFLALLTSTNLYALSMQEAIDLALIANHSIKEQEHILNETKYNYKSSQGKFYPSLNITYGQTTSNRKNNYNQNTTNSFGANIQYNLFNGFSDFYNTKSQKYLYEAQKYYLQSTTEDIILLVKSAYINILRQKQSVIVAKQSKDLLEEQKRESAEFYRVGFIPKNDLLAVEVELNKAIQNLLSAQSMLNYYIKTLERYTRIKINLDDINELQLHTPTLVEEKLKSIMLEKRAEILYLDNIIQSKDSNIKSARGEFLPDLNLIGEYTNSDNLKNSKNVNNESTIQLQVSINIFNGLSDKYNLESAKTNKMAFTSQRANLIEELELQLFNAIENYNLALNAYEVSKVALTQAEENYRISKNRYKARIMSTSDFLDAEYLLTEARSNVVLNRYAIIQSLAEIERITQSKLVSFK
ncbi:TolC family protein [Helicobacter sp. WB40]|uniref:TolC family protein n=1 Tax=Helicobacter sp. WB40 TaxID=3004130 RepID=UPI0022EBC3A5|nr:TolC family protein [Helicobacter sp. WB40]MDA3966522.1 TolC family protein [Helicobacter sp. WB40]